MAKRPLTEFFKDDGGALSCTRLLVFTVVVTVLGVWVWGNICAGHYVPMSLSEAGLISAAVGGKVAHSHFEYEGPK